VKTPKEINRVTLALRRHERELQTECIFTEATFASALYLYACFDVLTYSISSSALFKNRPIRRLIYGVGSPPVSTEASIQLSHTHAKLWICYNTKPGCPPDVYIGSANATDMTLLELIIKVNSPQARMLVEYFNLLWKANYK
jgi:hypothetical protein